MIQPHRHSRQTLAKRTCLVQPEFEELQDFLERYVATRRAALVIYRQAADMHGSRARLHVQK